VGSLQSASVICAHVQGSFADGTFAAYIPATMELELCDVPDD